MSGAHRILVLASNFRHQWSNLPRAANEHNTVHAKLQGGYQNRKPLPNYQKKII